MNILITSCSRDVTLIKAFRRALHNHGGGKVIAADMNPLSAALYFADEYIIIPRSDSPNFIQTLLELCKKKEIRLLVSSRDAELPILAEAKSAFERIACQVMVAEYETIRICRDKRLFYQFCKENSLPIPETYDSEDNIKFPAFMKPAIGAGSRKTHKVNNQSEYAFLKNGSRNDFIIQEYIDDPEYTIDLFADFKGEVISAIPRERIKTISGESYIGRTIKNDLMIQQSILLSKKLGLIGHNTLQCFFSGSDVKFTEVNPRFGGGANLGFQSGVNTPELLIRILSGEKIKPMISQFQEDLVMLRYTQDIFLENVSSDQGKVHLRIEKSGDGNRIYCIDVDGTICTENVEYEMAQPIEKTIRKINKLYDNGNTIILYTARGAYSGHDWSELTQRQLKTWGVKYHQFRTGKPFAHQYIDNKAVHILDWI